MPPQTNKAVKDSEQQNAEERESAQSNATDPNGRNSYTRQEFPNGKKTTIDYSKSKVNIAQILTDFKNTAVAIGSPSNIIDEVDQYLSIAESESLKADPNKKRIQSNLKNAANILDEFISKTLNKKSKVVENWIDALFLQQVNYKSDPSTVNEDFLVKLPDKETGDMTPISKNLASTFPKADVPTDETPLQLSSQEIVAEETAQESESLQSRANVYIPQNPEVRKALVQGKNYIASGETEKAFEAFQSAAQIAQNDGDDNAFGMACFEIGKIYDENDNLEEALNYYNQAHQSTNDNNLKARAYYSMAQIYDDVVYFEPAMEHYFAAISYAGEADNLNAQSKALSDIADMYAERYDVYNTHQFYGEAKNLALETDDSKTMGAIWSRCGDSMSVLNESTNALQDYKAAAQFYEKADSPLKTAKNYEKASTIMLQLGNKQKAQSLLAKAQQLALDSDDIAYATKLAKQLGTVV